MTKNSRQYPLPPAISQEPARKEVDRLLADLQKAGYGKYPALSSGLAGCLILCLGMFAILCTTRTSNPVLSFSVLVFIFAACWTVMRNTARTYRRKKVTLELVNYDDIRVIGPLLSALEWPDALAYERPFRRTLTKLLPQLTASDALLLTDAHRARLHRELVQPDAEYCCAILKALEQIGDESSLEFVRPLAEGLPLTTDPNSVRAVAKECFQVLAERAEKKQSRERLLRPAEGDPAGTLLHPISTQGSGDSDQLLRAGQAEPAGPSEETNPHAS